MTMEHIKRSFSVSLQVRHPTIDPEVITTTFGMIPRFKHRVGDQKKRSDGVEMKGNYAETYWSHQLDMSGAPDLVPYLETLVAGLQRHLAFLEHISATGGNTELFCGIFTESNWDESIPHRLSGNLAQLKIDLRLDAYPEMDGEPNQSTDPKLASGTSP
jgi:hypothetical protein